MRSRVELITTINRILTLTVCFSAFSGKAETVEFHFRDFQDLSPKAELTSSGALIKKDDCYRICEQLCTPWFSVDQAQNGVFVESIFDIDWDGKLARNRPSETLFQIRTEVVNKRGEWDFKTSFFQTSDMNTLNALGKTSGGYILKDHHRIWASESFDLLAGDNAQICILDVRPQTALLFKKLSLVTDPASQRKGLICRTIRDALTHDRDFNGLIPLHLDFKCEESSFADTEVRYDIALTKKLFDRDQGREETFAENGQIVCLFDSSHKWQCFYDLSQARTGSISHFKVKAKMTTVSKILDRFY